MADEIPDRAPSAPNTTCSERSQTPANMRIERWSRAADDRRSDQQARILVREETTASAPRATCARSADQEMGRSRHAESKIATAAAAISPVPKIRSPS
jgi:hypothetical protein